MIVMSTQLPVFVFPNNINFTKQNLVQTLTIYNPYDFSLKFIVLSTKPQSFSVSTSEGTIRKKCCIDIVIRLLDENHDAHFQVITSEVCQGGQSTARTGRRQLTVSFSDELEHKRSEELPFHPVTTLTSHVSPPRQYELARASQRTHLLLFYLIGLICIVILSLPSQTNSNENESMLPKWMHLTVNVKLVAAYVLGIVTVTIIRS